MSTPSNGSKPVPSNSCEKTEIPTGVSRPWNTRTLKAFPRVDFPQSLKAKRAKISFGTKERPTRTVNSKSKFKGHGFTIFPGIAGQAALDKLKQSLSDYSVD